MKTHERAWQVWPVLAYAASNRQMLTYEMVGQLTGMAIPGLGSVLEPIQSYCLLKGLPPLTVLVVNKKTGLPGIGFVAADDLATALIEVFERDWRNVGCPTPEVLLDAVRKLPSNGLDMSVAVAAAAKAAPPSQPQAKRRREPGKYYPLREHLEARHDLRRLRMTFDEIALILGEPLPESALKHRAWWSNQVERQNRPQAAAWMDAGFIVGALDQKPDGGWVEFLRQ